jgi:hypothetical protein
MSLDEADKSWIREQLQDMETRILTAFHNWASPHEARQRSHSFALRAVDLEYEALEKRVAKLEGK